MYKKALIALAVGIALIGALGVFGVVGLMVGGGYWENLPAFSSVSGPKRFKQYVVDPIPNYISSLRGGYSGFPQGEVRTYFSFSKQPSEWAFLKDWIEIKVSTDSYSPDHVFVQSIVDVDGQKPRRIFSSGSSNPISRVFQYAGEVARHTPRERYLAVSETVAKGMLYVP